MELTKAQGECWIVLKDGSLKAVNVGDILPEGVLLVSPSDVELTPPAMASANNPIPDETIPSAGSEISPAVEQELAAIQQAIQDGQDPTEIAQATASGGASAGGIAGSGNAGVIVTERTAKATISEAGFDTIHSSRDPQHQYALPGDEIAGMIEHPPVAFDQQQSISEDTPTLFAQVPAAQDPDSDGINPQGYTLVNGVQSGQLTLNADGSYQYIPSPEFQSLREGETRQVSFTYVATDPSGNQSAPATVTITITGTNDTATIGVATPGADQGAVKEDVTLTTGSRLVATDVDHGEAVFQPQTQIKGAHGTFSIDTDGNWTYELDNNDPLVQALKEGESLPSETFVVNSADGSALHTVTVAITGTNDSATIGVATPGADQGAVKEDVTLTTGGKLVATDVDHGEAVVQPQTQVKGAHGTFSIDKDGNWTYELDNNDPLVQALKEGESLPSETFVVNSADGSAQHTVTVAITGTNDTATIGVATPGADQGAVKEDVTLTTGGKLVATDVDHGEAVFQPQTQVKGAHGTFSIDTDGNWTYELDNNDPLVQALKEGESLPSETFVVNSADGSALHTVTVAITGTNDSATIGVATPGADQGAVKEDVTLTTGGKLVATDVDHGEAVVQPQTQVKGAHGTFSIDKDGNWTYELDNNDPLVQALKEGESLPSETFVVNSADGSALHTVTVAITGTNDSATIGVATPGADQGAVKEDVTLTTGGKLVATDVDHGEAVVQPQTQVKGAHGTFSIDKDGNWTYELDNNDPLVQALKEGESLPSETFVVNSADGSAQHTVTVAITGTNEAPVAQDDGLANNKTVTLDGQNWDTSGDIKVDYYVIDAKTGQKVADAEKSDYTGDGDHRFGVKSGIEQPGADTVQAGQLGYLDSADQSEAMRFTFQQGQVANHATIQVKNLWSDIAHGSWEPGIERGVWKAFYKGELVATGIFEGTSGGRQDVQIDAGGRYFDTIEMSAIGYKDGIVDPKGSEYFITQVTADLTRFDKAYQTNETGSLSLDVLGNDSDPNGDAITIVPGSYPDYVTLVNGKLQFDAAKYLLTLPEVERDLAAGEAKEIKFDYVIRDTHGATDHASVTITLIGETQAAPAPLHVTVQEDGLAGGAHAHSEGPLPGAQGATSHDYQFATQQPGTAASSAGKPLSYEVSSDGLTLTGFIMEAGQKLNVLTAQLNPQSGTYQLDLFRPLDHGTAGKDTLSLPFELDIKIGNQHTKGELVIDVIDSAPAPAHLTLTTGDMAPQSNSVIIALDMSGSMNDYVKDANGQWATRWSLSQQAIKAMFEQYDKLGDVQFKIATHAGYPDGQISGWLHSQAEIQQFFSKLSPAGWTPYAQALNQLDAILSDRQDQQAMAGSNKQFYFLSDGAPSDFGYWLNNKDQSEMFRDRLMKGISPDEVGGEQHYQDLLTGRVEPTKAEQLLILGESMEHILNQHGNPFDNVNMLAIGQSSSLEYLTPMAGHDGTAIKVEKDADLISTLTESVPGQLHGDLTGPSIEGEWVDSLAHDGHTYFYDQQQNGIFAHNNDTDIKIADGSKLTLDTANGKLALNFETGQYDYQAKDVHGDGEDKFLLTLRDGDGDTADTSLVIKVTDLQGGISASPLTQGTEEKSAAFAHSVPLLGTEAQDALIELPVSQPAASVNHMESPTTTGIAISDLLGHDEMGSLLTQVVPATQHSAGSVPEVLTVSALPDDNGPDLLSHTMSNPVFDELLSQQQFIQ
ncbi:retention module-containing protein [Aeromonas hydrophila]|uniref:retention module-containing protein n=1 Tax=Aeromonas hydrophila TaxID=644 RepID=UPI001C788E9C|nr:retention module-containing protein [Aeromonas hydrophila]QWL70513.1 retention module-containing protein [Aeromonas hydrophila]